MFRCRDLYITDTNFSAEIYTDRCKLGPGWSAEGESGPLPAFKEMLLYRFIRDGEDSADGSSKPG